MFPCVDAQIPLKERALPQNELVTGHRRRVGGKKIKRKEAELERGGIREERVKVEMREWWRGDLSWSGFAIEKKKWKMAREAERKLGGGGRRRERAG